MLSVLSNYEKERLLILDLFRLKVKKDKVVGLIKCVNIGFKVNSLLKVVKKILGFK